MTLTVTEAGLSLADPTAYADEDRFHQATTLLRREAPVHRVEADGYRPVLGGHPARRRHGGRARTTTFLNAPRPLLRPPRWTPGTAGAAEGIALRTLIHMDDPTTSACGPSAPTGSNRDVRGA